MARPQKTGLEYFPLDVDYFEDEKIEAISGEFGPVGELATVKLLCLIYNNGYYVEWTSILKMKLLKRLPGVELKVLDKIIGRLLEFGFFDKKQFESYNVLTSNDIQEKYSVATKRRQSTSPLLYGVNVYNNPPSSVDNADVNTPSSEVITNIGTQSKVKESKVKESKGEGGSKPDQFVEPTVDEIKDHVRKKYEASSKASELFTEKFYDHYSSTGWTVKGGEKMKQWTFAISKTWKPDLVALMESYPKSKELEAESLSPEALLERQRRKSQYDNIAFGNSIHVGKRIEFGDHLSIYHKQLGFPDELRD